jgi:Family of unknown function (DUF6130)
MKLWHPRRARGAHIGQAAAALLLAGALTATVATAAALRSEKARPAPSIQIVSVEPMRVTGNLRGMFDRVYEVRVRIRGWKMYPVLGAGATQRHNRPDGGHWHLYVDGEYASASNDDLAHTWYLRPGTHAVNAQLTNVDHTPLGGEDHWSQTVQISVP